MYHKITSMYKYLYCYDKIKEQQNVQIVPISARKVFLKYFGAFMIQRIARAMEHLQGTIIQFWQINEKSIILQY